MFVKFPCGSGHILGLMVWKIDGFSEVGKLDV